MKALLIRKGNGVGDNHAGGLLHKASMKAPPKRKGNQMPRPAHSTSTPRLKESPYKNCREIIASSPVIVLMSTPQ